MKVSLSAIHEAGHAVVAAYLHVPFTHVTIKPGKDKDENGNVALGYVRPGEMRVKPYSWRNHKTDFQLRSEKDIKRAIAKQRTNRAIVILAARAADEMYFSNPPENAYAYDDEDLREQYLVAWRIEGPWGTITLPADADVETWRATLLDRAREIVRIPYVNQTIRMVALDLDAESSIAKRGLPAKQVRDTLRYFKMKSMEKKMADEVPQVTE